MTTTIQKMDTQSDLVSNIFVHGVAFDLNIKSWRARRSAQSVFQELGIDPKYWNDNLIGGAVIRLIDKETEKRFMSYESGARNWLDRNSYPFLGLRFVPYTVIDRLVNGDGENPGLAKIKADFEQEVAGFLANFDTSRQEYIEAMATKDESYRLALQNIYPSSNSVATKFSFNWSMFEISVPKSDGESQTAAHEVSLNEASATAKAKADIATQVKQTMQTQANDFVVEAVTILRQKTIDALRRFRNVLNNDNAVKTSSINSIRRAIDDFNLLNFTGDSEMTALLDQFQLEIAGVDSISKADTNVKVALGSVVDTIIKQAQDFSKINTVAGRFVRGIDLS